MRHVRGPIVAVATLAGVAGVLALNPDGPQPTARGTGGPAPGGPTGTITSGSADPESPEPVTATYAGAEYPTKWGTIQVAATVTDGVLVDISFLSLPQDSRSVRINQWAAPALVEEALAVQSAEVDTISGATYTSEGFRYSLQSILEQAGL